jgi:HK97 family phage major capsid protein
MNVKALIEQRAEKLEELQAIADTCEKETRALTEEEQAKFDELEGVIKSLDGTIEKLRSVAALGNTETEDKDEPEKKDDKEQEKSEERAFAAYLRGQTELRADVTMTSGDNGAVIPSTIINKIIDKVKDISPIFQMSTIYNAPGTIQIPYVDDSAKTIQVAFAEDFKELESSAANLKSISLSGHLAGALSLIGKSLLNNSAFDITSFVIDKMAQSIAEFIEDQLLNGSANIEGLAGGVTQTVTAASATKITVDELIDTQEAVRDVFQRGAVWIMNRETRAAIRKLKDNDGKLLLNPDATAAWGYTLLGKPVYCSDAMSAPAAGKTAIYYGDFSGLAVKLTENAEIEVLRENYATQHAIGIYAYLELDAKVENAQKIAALQMKAGS